MPFSLLALILFLVVYTIIALLFLLAAAISPRQKAEYDERQQFIRGNAYKYGFLALLIALLGNGFIEYCTDSSWGTPFAEAFVIASIGISVFWAICVMKGAYFSYSEVSSKKVFLSILWTFLVGCLCLYVGVFTQQKLIAQHSAAKFDNICLIIGITTLFEAVIMIARAIMEHLQKEE